MPALRPQFRQPQPSQACSPSRSLDDHVTGTEPQVRATVDRIQQAVEALGLVTVLPERTRIAVHVRMSFAAFTPRQRWLDDHVVLARRLTQPGSATSRCPPRGTCRTPSA
jgi:hypothetical protein